MLYIRENHLGQSKSLMCCAWACENCVMLSQNKIPKFTYSHIKKQQLETSTVDSTVTRAFALLETNLGLILSILYGPLSPPEITSECKAKGNSTSRSGQKQAKEKVC